MHSDVTLGKKSKTLTEDNFGLLEREKNERKKEKKKKMEARTGAISFFGECQYLVSGKRHLRPRKNVC